jgi:hypothetical protein
MLHISRQRSRCCIRFNSSIRACSRSWRVCGRTGSPWTLLLSLSHTCLMGLISGLTAGHSISWMSSSCKTALVMCAILAQALSCMSTNSESTPFAATNTCCSSICSMYPTVVRLPQTMTRSIRPSILMPPHTITEPCLNWSLSWKTFGMYFSRQCLHSRWCPPRCVRGNLDSSVNNTDLHWRSCQLTWLWANRRRAARCCFIKWGTQTGRLGCKDTSLNLFLTVWSDTVTPVTHLRSCCSSLAVAERCCYIQMVRYWSSCGVVMHPQPCPTLLVNWLVSL